MAAIERLKVERKAIRKDRPHASSLRFCRKSGRVECVISERVLLPTLYIYFNVSFCSVRFHTMLPLVRTTLECQSVPLN